MPCALVPFQINRLWRARKDHTWIDARVRQHDDSTGVELQLFYDGVCVFSQTCASRDIALAEADDRLRELRRAGWSPHW